MSYSKLCIMCPFSLYRTGNPQCLRQRAQVVLRVSHLPHIAASPAYARFDGSHPLLLTLVHQIHLLAKPVRLLLVRLRLLFHLFFLTTLHPLFTRPLLDQLVDLLRIGSLLLLKLASKPFH